MREPMTVAKLIKKLQSIPRQDIPVYIEVYDDPPEDDSDALVIDYSHRVDVFEVEWITTGDGEHAVLVPDAYGPDDEAP